MATHASAIPFDVRRHDEVEAHAMMRWIAPVGRALLAAIFLVAAPGHFTQEQVDYASGHGVPMAGLLVPLSGLMALVGGLCILAGFHARLGALLLVAFLVPVTIMMHDFWNVTEPQERTIQRIMFLKNLSMLGGALLLAYFGAGPVSLDARRTATSS